MRIQNITPYSKPNKITDNRVNSNPNFTSKLIIKNTASSEKTRDLLKIAGLALMPAFTQTLDKKYSSDIFEFSKKYNIDLETAYTFKSLDEITKYKALTLFQKDNNSAVFTDYIYNNAVKNSFTVEKTFTDNQNVVRPYIISKKTNFRCLPLQEDIYNGKYRIKNNYEYDAKGNLKSKTSVQYSDSGKIEALTKSEYVYDGKDRTNIMLTENEDYIHNIKTIAKFKTLESGDNQINMLLSQKRIYKNSTADKTKIHIMELSNVEGVYNSKIIRADGKIVPECTAIKAPDGSIKIVKNLVSTDGTKTNYIYEASPKKSIITEKHTPAKSIIIDSFGKELLLDISDNVKPLSDIKMFYQIKSKDGEVLTTIDREFHRLDNTHAYSSVNGHEYEMIRTKEGIEVTNLNTKQTETILYGEILDLNSIDLYSTLDNMTLNENRQNLSTNDIISMLVELLNNFSGDELLSLKHNGTKLAYATESNSKYKPINNTIYTSDNMFIASHERAHSNDLRYSKDKYEEKSRIRVPILEQDISNHSIVRNTYETEKLNFEKNYPDVQRDIIGYFIKDADHKNGTNMGYAETTAESGAMFSLSTGYKELAQRTFYLQKEFPKTIAENSKHGLLPHNNIAIEKGTKLNSEKVPDEKYKLILDYSDGIIII